VEFGSSDGTVVEVVDAVADANDHSSRHTTRIDSRRCCAEPESIPYFLAMGGTPLESRVCSLTAADEQKMNRSLRKNPVA
jgi:hypothetical protein